MFRQHVKHHHQWLRSSIHLPNLVRAPLIQSGYKALQKDQALASCIQFLVKVCNRKGGKCKISWVLQSPVSSPQASPKVEASDRPEQAQHLPTCRKVQNGNTRVHQGLSDSRGMGVIDRPIRRLPSNPHPAKLKEELKVLPQVTGVPVHLPSLRASHGPTGLYNDCKRSEADGPDKMTRGNRVSECDGRPVQVEPSPVNRMVTASAGVQRDLSQVVHSSCRSICHSTEPQSSTVCISSPRPKG